MGTHTVWDHADPFPGSQTVGNDGVTTLVCNAFRLDRDLNGWFSTGAAVYVDPANVDDLPAQIGIFILNGDDLAESPARFEVADIGAGGWIEVEWDTPLSMSNVQSPRYVGYEMLDSTVFLYHGTIDEGQITSYHTDDLVVPGVGVSPTRSFFTSNFGPTTNGNGNLYGVDIKVTGPNVAPTVNITSDLYQNEMRLTDTANLSGNVDDDGEITFREWSILSGPSASNAQFSSLDTDDTVFTPLALGTYVIQLRVGDDEDAFTNDTITMVCLEPTNLIITTADSFIGVKNEEKQITATTTGGFGPKTYAWEQSSGPVGTLTNDDEQTVTFEHSAAADYELTVTVTDLIDSAVKSVSLRLLNGAPPPSGFFRRDGVFWVPQVVEYL